MDVDFVADVMIKYVLVNSIRLIVCSLYEENNDYCVRIIRTLLYEHVD